jgi:hypothetical protein
MNANVVTAKQTDAPFGFDLVPPCRDVGIPRQPEHPALTSRPPPATLPCKIFGALGPPAIALISLKFFDLTEIDVSRIVSQIFEDRFGKLEGDTCSPIWASRILNSSGGSRRRCKQHCNVGARHQRTECRELCVDMSLMAANGAIAGG